LTGFRHAKQEVQTLISLLETLSAGVNLSILESYPFPLHPKFEYADVTSQYMSKAKVGYHHLMLNYLIYFSILFRC